MNYIIKRYKFVEAAVGWPWFIFTILISGLTAKTDWLYQKCIEYTFCDANHIDNKIFGLPNGALVAILCLIVLFIKVLNYAVEHLDAKDKIMTTHDIYKYLQKDSKWGWKSYARLKSWWAIPDSARNEMERAGKNGDVKYIGRHVNVLKDEQIDRSYWEFAKFNETSLNHVENKPRTDIVYTNEVISELSSYNVLGASTLDVKKTWPSASFLLKIFSRLIVWFTTTKLFWWNCK